MRGCGIGFQPVRDATGPTVNADRQDACPTLISRHHDATFFAEHAAMSALAFVGSASGADEPPMSLPLVGYNEHRTNLPRGEARQCQHESGDGREGGWHRPAFDRLYWLKTLGFIPEDCGADIDSLGRSFLVNGSRHDLQEEFWLAANDERALVHHDALLRINGTSSATC